MYTIEKLFHKLVGIFLLPVYKETAYFSYINVDVQTDFFKGSVDKSALELLLMALI